MLTADTITDEQIREWESDVLAHGTDAQKRRAVDLATRALVWPLTLAKVQNSYRHQIPVLRRAEKRRIAARASCAEILNARAVKP